MIRMVGASMPLDLSAVTHTALGHRSVPGTAALTTLPPAARFILRGRPAAIEAAGTAFGTALPQVPCRAATGTDGRAALWLGPDEWLLLARPEAGQALADTLERAMQDQPHALVDVSHRQVGIAVSGPDAAATLNAGCPLDLDPAAFPVGMCTRTVLGKSEIVLWRTGPETFRLGVWRSFADYAWRFLEEASRGFRPQAAR